MQSIVVCFSLECLPEHCCLLNHEVPKGCKRLTVAEGDETVRLLLYTEHDEREDE